MSLLPFVLWDAPIVRRLNQNDAQQALRFLEVNPALNAFALGWIHENNIVPIDAGHRFQFLGAYHHDSLVAVCLLAGRGTACLCTDDERAAHAIGTNLRRSGLTLNALIGPSAPVDRLWQAYTGAGMDNARKREQVALELRSRDLRFFGEPLLRHAELDDLDAVFSLSLAMLAEEQSTVLGADESIAFRENTAARIASQRVYVLEDIYSGELIFKASLSAISPKVAQIEGVFVAPAWRGRGVGRRALSEMIRELLLTTERVSLYTDADNHAALALYRRLGFRFAGAYATLIAELH